MKSSMSKKIAITILMVFIVCSNIRAQSIYSQESIKEVMDKVNTYQFNNPWAEYDDNWIRGTYYAGVMACYFATEYVAYLNQSEDLCNSLNWSLPSKPASPHSSGGNILTLGQTMIQCYMVKPEKNKIRLIIYHLEDPNMVKNALSKPDQWYWEGGVRFADGLFTGPPALAMLHSVTGNEKYLQWMEAYFWDVYGKLYDPTENLFYRDRTMFPVKLEERKNDPNWKGNKQVTVNGKKVLWSRGNGWVIAGIVRILEYLPKDHGSYKRYELLLQRMAKSLKGRQSEEGFWYPNLADPDHPHVKETSGTGFLTYGIAYGINNRILDREEYLPVVKKAWKSLTDAVSAEGKVQWGQIVGDRPSDVSKEDSHEYVSGTFLLAASEMYKLNLEVAKAKKRMDLAIVRKDIMNYMENELRGANKPYGYYRQYPADAEKYGLYGSLDISLIRTIMGEDFKTSLTKKQRQEWISHINSFALKDGTYTSDWHNPTHRNGMVISALGPLGGKNLYQNTLYDKFNTVDKLNMYLDNEIDWAQLWADSLVQNNAVSVKYYEMAHFDNPLHYHKELELSYIIEGYGTRYVGSSINPYKNGDLVLLGQELTHVWIGDDVFYEEHTDLLTKAIVIKFDIDFAGKDFFSLEEAKAIKNVLKEAGGGLRIKGPTNKVICGMMQNMIQQSPLEQIISLIQILNVISKFEDVHILSSYDFHKSKNVKEKDRMNKIVQYTMLQFKQNITLEEISQVANLSKSGFCRYFKNSIKKSYMEFLYEIRVQYACKLMLEKDLGIKQISYEAGFNNPSAFSQIFKRLKGVPPNKYRKEKSNKYL